jgi:hypothetical protein
MKFENHEVCGLDSHVGCPLNQNEYRFLRISFHISYLKVSLFIIDSNIIDQEITIIQWNHNLHSHIWTPYTELIVAFCSFPS